MRIKHSSRTSLRPIRPKPCQTGADIIFRIFLISGVAALITGSQSYGKRLVHLGRQGKYYMTSKVTMVLSMDRWVGKVAVVTGASSGIGAKIAELLVKEGMKVVGLARRNERIEELSKKLSAEKGKLYAVKTDMSKEEDIVNAFKWIKDTVGPVHVLVNNAGIVKYTSLVDGDAEKWRQVMDVNVIGLCIATREAVRQMRANNIDGHVIHINSGLGHQVINIPGICVYPASKFAVRALAETLKNELYEFGTKIKITNLSPGVVESEFGQSERSHMDPKLLESLKNSPKLKAEDIADATIYVLSTPPHVQVQELLVQPLRKVM